MRRTTGVGDHGAHDHDLSGTHYQQDIDLNKLFSDVAAYSERVMGPAHVGNVVDMAIKTAISRRTPAHITIPKDVQDWTVDDERSKANIPRHSGDLYSDPCLCLRHVTGQGRDAHRMPGQKLRSWPAEAVWVRNLEFLQLANCWAHWIGTGRLLGRVQDDGLTTGGIGLLGTAPLRKRWNAAIPSSSPAAASPIWSSIQNRARPGAN